ncbi:MAG: hypothetical protein K1X83_14280 [Oligoflexia bacterium]|nr:hypothetical protein [Oligoflexia bacterium]
MADALNPLGLLSGTSGSQAPGTTETKKSGQIGKNEFLQLLVTQLKHQDPLNPMDNQEFAVQLAQFSQLEQLMEINQKTTGTGETQDFSSMASYLGHEVVLNNSTLQVSGGDAGAVQFELAANASSMKAEILDSKNQVVATKDLGALSSGKHYVELNGLSLQNGQYTVRVSGQGVNGQALAPDAYAAGMVSGFIPGADPSLLIGAREIKTADIKEVSLARNA